MTEGPYEEAPEMDDNEAEEPRPFPRCPHCGWSNVRFSYTRNAIDVVLGVLSVKRFKCRACGRYFRRWYRAEE